MHRFQVVSTAKLTATSSHYIQSEKELCIFLFCAPVWRRINHTFLYQEVLLKNIVLSSLKLVE